MSVQDAIESAAKRKQSGLRQGELSRLERQFLAEYVRLGLNGVAAATAIHRGGRFPDRWASKVLARPWVKAELERRLQASEAASAATIEAIREEYRRLAFLPFEGPWLGSHKLQALDRLGNHLGMFRPDVAVSTQVSFSFVGSPRHGDVIEGTKDDKLLIDKDIPK